MKRCLPALLAVLWVLCCGITAFASGGNVIYSGNAEKFMFAPGSSYSPTDLFPEFKDVMPGDTLSQKIVFRNDASEKVKIKVYMRALGAHADSEPFLSQLRLRVEKMTDTVMFDAAASQTAQLSDWVCLGTLYSGGEVELNVLLDVPVTLDNSYSNAVGYLDWEFAVEELPIEPTDPEPPKTGDDHKLGLYLSMSVVSAMLILWLLTWRRRKAEG